MDYKDKWEYLKEWLEQAIEEGQNRGFDKQEFSAEGGMFYTYVRVLNEIKYMDGERK